MSFVSTEKQFVPSEKEEDAGFFFDLRGWASDKVILVFVHLVWFVWTTRTIMDWSLMDVRIIMFRTHAGKESESNSISNRTSQIYNGSSGLTEGFYDSGIYLRWKVRWTGSRRRKYRVPH